MSELKFSVWQQWHYYCYHKGALSSWCQLLFNYELGRLQGSFSQTDVRTLIKFHVLLGKNALECYKSLNEGLGTHATSHKAVRQWVKAIKNVRQEETDDAPCSGAQHWWHVNATWNRCNPSLKVHAVFHAWPLLEKSESLKQVFNISSPADLGNKKFVESGLHMCSMMTQ
jgi:hypothetical protein